MSGALIIWIFVFYLPIEYLFFSYYMSMYD